MNISCDILKNAAFRFSLRSLTLICAFVPLCLCAFTPQCLCAFRISQVSQ